jgi:DMSO/TMAO reductase YedYZ molybdopterin-dependent catalytic subunit
LRTTEEPFCGGKKIGAVAFADEGLVPMDTDIGAELDGRLYTDLSRLSDRNPILPTKAFYVRTRASTLLPDAQSWHLSVDGLVEQPSILTMKDLKSLTRPMGLHLMERAGNPRMASFGMVSVANWQGVPLSEILHKVKVKSQATRVLIAGFDHYATEAVTSVPGAS